MTYKITFEYLNCNRFTNAFMHECDLVHGDIGLIEKLSYTTTTEPTKEYINKMIDKLKDSKNHEELGSYMANVKLKSIEIIDLEE